MPKTIFSIHVTRIYSIYPEFKKQVQHLEKKGSVERINGLIRRFLPKKTDFAKITHKRIKEIEFLLNNRPRKCLGFKIPA